MKNIFAIIGLSTLLLFTACTYETEKVSEQKKEPIPIKTITIQQKQTKEVKSYFGTLSFSTSTNFKAQQSGVINKLTVQPGQHINKGETIVVYPPLNHQLQINQAKIEQQKLAKDYQRQNELYKVGAVSKVSVENYKSQLDLSNNSVKQLQKVNAITAPFSGIITQVNVSLGEEVAVDQPLFSMAKTQDAKVDFYVTAQEIHNIQLGTEVFIENNAQKIEGSISKKSIQFDEKRKAFLVTATFKNSNSLFTGNTVELQVKMNDTLPSIIVPSKAVKVFGGYHFIFIAENDKAVLKQVEIGKQTEKQIQIIKGLNEGEKLIIEGSEKLEDNAIITIVN